MAADDGAFVTETQAAHGGIGQPEPFRERVLGDSLIPHGRAKRIRFAYCTGSMRVSLFSRSYTQPSSLKSPVAVRAATHGWVFRFVSC